MISSSLFVLLLATYAYSIPVGDNLIIKNQVPQVTTSESVVLNLLDDGESKNVVNLVETTSATIRKNGLPLTTQNPLLNNERVTRGMVESSTEFELSPQGIEDRFTTSETLESSSGSVLAPREVEDKFTTSEPIQSSTGSELSPRGIEDKLTTSEPIQSSPSSGFRTREAGKLNQLYPTSFESAAQFNSHAIRGEIEKLDMTLQTTEEPLSSSVASFATTTGLLRGVRGEESEVEESSSTQMNDVTTGESKTVIEVFAGPNTNAEIIPGKNSKTEVIPGENTKTEITSSSGDKIEIIKTGSNKLAGKQEQEQQQQPLSEGKN